MKVLEWPQHFSHYKYMLFFQDAQEQVTSQSAIETSWYLSSYLDVMIVLLPARMKKIRIKVKALEEPKDNMLTLRALKGR